MQNQNIADVYVSRPAAVYYTYEQVCCLTKAHVRLQAAKKERRRFNKESALWEGSLRIQLEQEALAIWERGTETDEELRIVPYVRNPVTGHLMLDTCHNFRKCFQDPASDPPQRELMQMSCTPWPGFIRNRFTKEIMAMCGPKEVN